MAAAGKMLSRASFLPQYRFQPKYIVDPDAPTFLGAFSFLKSAFIPFDFVSDCVRVPGRYICSGFGAYGDTDGIQPRV
jgi:hypothetical protein